MEEPSDRMFRKILITDKVLPEEPLPVGLILQAMAEYQMLPMPTPAILRLVQAYQKPLLDPLWLKEQEAKMQEQMTMAENMQAGMQNMVVQQFGIPMPPNASDFDKPPE